MRRLIFMRHGQYEEDSASRAHGSLTPLGRKQAEHTATAMRRLKVDTIWASTLLRAKQSAAIVAAKLPRARVRRTSLLCEVIPTKLPRAIAVRMPTLEPGRVSADRARADRAFQELFREAKKVDRTEIVVCHGNLIRYFVCCALGIERKLWMRLDSTHCGLTEFRVLPHGIVRVVRYNDVGHIPLRMRTESGAARKMKKAQK